MIDIIMLGSPIGKFYVDLILKENDVDLHAALYLWAVIKFLHAWLIVKLLLRMRNIGYPRFVLAFQDVHHKSYNPSLAYKARGCQGEVSFAQWQYHSQ